MDDDELAQAVEARRAWATKNGVVVRHWNAEGVFDAKHVALGKKGAPDEVTISDKFPTADEAIADLMEALDG